MSLVLNEEQVATQDAAKRLIQSQSPVSALRTLRDSKDDNGFDRALWQSMVELGWAGILIPEEFGGLGLTPGYLSVILEESGRNLTSSPLWSSAFFASYLLVNSHNSELKQQTLTAMATGECLVSVALEEKARHAPYDIVTLVSAGSTPVLKGRKHFVVNGHVADKFIVSARNEQGELKLVVLDSNQQGVVVERNWMVDSHNSASVFFDGVQLGADQILKTDDAGVLFESALDAARLGLAAEMLGTATEAFERTLAYLKEREQFGVIIGTFQALKHRAALMFVELELSRSAVREGFAALDAVFLNDARAADVNELSRLASIAKMQLSQTLHLISSESVQLHGGIGMTDEHEIGFYLKRARVLEQLLGDERFHIDRFATLSGY